MDANSPVNCQQLVVLQENGHVVGSALLMMNSVQKLIVHQRQLIVVVTNITTETEGQ